MSLQKQLEQKILAQHECRFVFIASRDTGETFAKYENGLPSEITQFQIKIICEQMDTGLLDQFYKFGINLGGEKYSCVMARQDMIIGRLGSIKLRIHTTNKYIVAAASAEFGVANSVEKLVKYLSQCV